MPSVLHFVFIHMVMMEWTTNEKKEVNAVARSTS